MLVFRPNVDLSGFGVSVALVAGAILLMLLLEPLCLHLFGTTPGKALLGLHIERPDGGRLGYGEAARRTFDVLTYGLGFHVPVLSQVLLICSWLRHRDGRPLRWEAGSELRLDKKRLGLLTVGYILLACLASFTGFVNEELSQMPKKPRRHHGGGVLRKLQRPRAHGRLFALVHLAHPRRMGAHEHEPDPARGTGLRGRVQLLRDRRRARKARTAPGENPRAHRHDFFDAGTGAGAQEQRMGP